ncbi:hypothetical protein [Sulfuricurvum sp.]|jgi:hypothetical protein|uniref:hypothetical protein n=1 Tax=Sulfuricurvum sp. TaxID=2025608 RepID=UPI002626D673|nr:hypothetical protein [Sulfuricurvum sp.]MDD2781679.1 hypothetical protein [Sulfuricurvum sp.]
MAKRKDSPNQSKFEIDIISKMERSNVSVSELRTGLWAPIEKVSSTSLIYKNFIKNKRSRAISTSWGKVLVTGNILTQVHRDLLDCIFASANNIEELEGGSVAVFFNETDVLKRYGNTAGSNHTWLRTKIREIRNTSIEMEDHSKKYYAFQILEDDGAIPETGEFKIVFSSKYRNYIEGQLTIGYIDELDKLLTIQSALLRAIVRFFWTHKDASKMEIKALLTTVGYPQDSENAIRTARREIESNIDTLEKFGISALEEEVTESGRKKIKKILYRKQEDAKITFSAPLQSLLSK